MVKYNLSVLVWSISHQACVNVWFAFFNLHWFNIHRGEKIVVIISIADFWLRELKRWTLGSIKECHTSKKAFLSKRIRFCRNNIQGFWKISLAFKSFLVVDCPCSSWFEKVYLIFKCSKISKVDADLKSWLVPCIARHIKLFMPQRCMICK